MTTEELGRIVALNGAIQATIVNLLLKNGAVDRATLSKRLAAIEAQHTTDEERAAIAMSVGLLRDFCSLPR